MSAHSYPMRTLSGDLVRAASGFVLTAVPLFLVRGALWPSLVLASAAGLFLLFGLRTALRRRLRIELTEDGIVATGVAGPVGLGGRAIDLRWCDLAMMRLRYFSTRRDRAKGWMELSLKAGESRLRMDSHLDGFRQIAARAARAAAANGLAVNPVTAGNFASLGIDLGQTAGPDEDREA